MDIRRSDQKHQDNPSTPSTGIRRENFKRNKQDQAPYFCDDTQKHTLVEPLRDPCPEQQVEDEQDVRWDGEQVCLERAKSKTLELQRDVVGCRCIGDSPDQAEHVNRPHIIVP